MPLHLQPREGRCSRRRPLWIAIVIAFSWAVGGANGSRGQEITAAISSGPDVSSLIRAQVKDLGYPDEVGDQFVQLVTPWNPGHWKRRIDQSRRREADGKETASEVSRVQSQALDEIRRRLAESFEQVDGKSDKYHLHRILDFRQSQCLGNCQLLIVLGGAVGLDVRPLDVMLPAKGGLGEHMFHSASIVRLADGRVRMVDQRWDLDSPPFVFTEHYGREGIHWRLLDDSNPLGLHRQIRVRDLRGLKADVWTSIGYSRLKASRLDDARDFFAMAQEHDPESTFTLLALAQIAVADGKLDEVDALLAKSLQLDPERAVVHAFRARLAAGAGRLRDALASYNVAILLFPESPDALYERGLVHRDLGNEEEAIADLTESLRIGPQHGLALVARGGIYAKKGEHSLALADLDAAIAVDSSAAIAHLQRGVALAHLGHKEEARRSIEASITPDPESRRRAEAAIQRFGL